MEGVLVKAPKAFPVGSSVNVAMHLSQGMATGGGRGLRGAARCGQSDGDSLGRLDMAESQRLQEFLLPLIPGVK